MATELNRPCHKCPVTPHPGVDKAGVVAMRMAKSAPQSVFVAWAGDDVDMIGHQTIRPHLHPMPPRRFSKQVEVKGIVAIFEKGLFAPIAAACVT